MIDIVIPSNNEAEFIEVATSLGYGGICFLYSLNKYLAIKEGFSIKSSNVDFNIYTGVLANSEEIIKFKNKVDKSVFIAVKSSDNDREVIENSKANLVFSFEDSYKRDFIHHRASGLNHILCKLAKENNITIGFSLSSILKSNNIHIILGRVMQNIRLCTKFKVKSVIASFAVNPLEMRSPHDLRSLFKLLDHQKPAFLEKEDL